MTLLLSVPAPESCRELLPALSPLEVFPLPKQPSMDDLMTALLTGKPVEAHQQANPTPPPLPAPATAPAPASEPQSPKRWRTLRTPDGLRPSPRQAQRDARQYAEAWYQALREWKQASYEVPAPTGSGRSGAVLLTSGTPGMITCYYLVTPLGRTVTATEAGRLISTWEASSIPAQRQVGVLLNRVRMGGGLASLLDERGGWNRNTADARAYAVAALSLAVALGDVNADGVLKSLKTCYDSVQLDQ